LNGGHCRFDSMAERMVPTPDGGWLPVYFNVWGAVAFAGVKELPPGLQERCVRIPMQKATGVEIPGHLRDGTSIELVTIRRQLAAWADSLFELPDPELPPVLMREAGRVGDNWRPLVAIADLAGGRWPALARQAALEEVAAEQQQTELERLLAAILRAFDRPAKTVPADAPDNRNRLRPAVVPVALTGKNGMDGNTGGAAPRAARQHAATIRSFMRIRSRSLAGARDRGWLRVGAAELGVTAPVMGGHIHSARVGRSPLAQFDVRGSA
jgi:hypothetical protein